MTAVDVRDSSSIRTRSLSTASSLSSSRMRRAVAAADEAGRDDGHAEPLERARDDDPLAARERQLLARPVPLPALEVRHGQDPVERRVHRDGDDHADDLLGLEPAADVVERPLRVPAYASEGARPRDRAVGDERRAWRRACRGRRRAPRRAAGRPATGSETDHRRHDALRQRTAEACDADDLLRRRRARAAACPTARSPSRRRARSRRRGRRGTARAPRRGAARGRRCARSGSARRAASRRSSRRVPCAAATSDQPASLVWPVLTPITPGKVREQVVPRVQRAAGDVRHALADDRAHERVVHEDLGELRHVARARVVARRRRARPDWRSACPSARARAPSRSSSPRRPGRSRCRRAERGRPRRRSRSGSAPPRSAPARSAAPRPRGRSTTRPPRRPARRTVTTSSSFACSSVTRTVISFVMLAIGTRASAFRWSSVSPLALTTR